MTSEFPFGPYNYYVVYGLSGKDGRIHMGCVQMLRPAPICSMEDIQTMADQIARDNGLPEVMIVGWRRFEKPEDPP